MAIASHPKSHRIVSKKNRIYKSHQNREKIESIIAHQNSAEKICDFFDFLQTFFTQGEIYFSQFAKKQAYFLLMSDRVY